jgi:hypothetical protein
MAFVANAQEEENLRSASALNAIFCIRFRAEPDFLSGPQANDLAHDPCSLVAGAPDQVAAPNHLLGSKFGEKC